MLSAPAIIPATSGSDLSSGVGTFVGRHAQVLVGEFEQPGLLGQGHHRYQSGVRHEIRVVEPRRSNGSSVG